MFYLNIYVNKRQEIIFHISKNKNSYYSNTYYLIETLVFNDDISCFQSLDDYYIYIQNWKKKKFKPNKLKKFIKFINKL